MPRLIIALSICFSVTSFALAESDAGRGKTLTAVCAACHGADGNSLVGAFPSLAGQGAKYLIKQMEDIKSGARPVVLMTGQLDNMSEQDMTDIAVYYEAQSIKMGTAKQDLVVEGEQIFRWGIKRKGVAACAACHSPTGSGVTAAGFPALAGQWPEYVATQLKAFRVKERTNDGDSRMMQDSAMDLSDREIDAVASYIYGMH